MAWYARAPGRRPSLGVRQLFRTLIDSVRSWFGAGPDPVARAWGREPIPASAIPTPRQPKAWEPRIPDPTPAALAHRPAPASWQRGLPAKSLDPTEVRKQVLTSLYQMRDQAEAPNDVAFLERLVRVVGTENLDFPPFPDVARKLDTLLKKGDPSMAQVVRLVERDPALVRRIWMAGSSAAFASAPESLHQAISRIGFDALWRIGMSICVHSPVFRVAGYQDRADAVREHGVVVAEMAAWLSGQTRGEQYIAGLLHDIGKLVVYRAASNKNPDRTPSEALLQRVIDRHHSEIGLLAASAWSLGDGVLEGIGYHHDPESGGPTAKVLWVADVATITAALSSAGQSYNGLVTLERADGWTPHAGLAILRKARSLIEGDDEEVDEGNHEPFDEDVDDDDTHVN